MLQQLSSRAGFETEIPEYKSRTLLPYRFDLLNLSFK